MGHKLVLGKAKKTKAAEKRRSPKEFRTRQVRFGVRRFSAALVFCECMVTESRSAGVSPDFSPMALKNDRLLMPIFRKSWQSRSFLGRYGSFAMNGEMNPAAAAGERRGVSPTSLPQENYA